MLDKIDVIEFIATEVEPYSDVNKEDIKVEHHLFDDIGADSLDFLELGMALESEYKMEIDDDEMSENLTVGALADLIIKIDKEVN